MTDIEYLNKKFGDVLGKPDGTRSRYSWFWEQGMLMNTKRWFICQLAPNPFTEEQWANIQPGKPFPGKLRWIPHYETALPLGMEPDVENTAFYIRSFLEQMAQAEQAMKDQAAGHMDAVTAASEAEAQASVSKASAEFEEMVGDFEPLSWKLGNPQPDGSQDGPVAFQVGGTRDEPTDTGTTA